MRQRIGLLHEQKQKGTNEPEGLPKRGLCRWLEFIYPTNVDTLVFFHGHAIPSVSGGQQGCPLRMMAHALVQRVVLESLSIVETDLRTEALAPVLEPRPVLDFAPGFADDGFFAASAAGVLRCITHVKTCMPSWGCNSLG